MKILGLERDNTTLPATPDPRGFRYHASFELYPFHEGKEKAVYKGILNGTGPRRGLLCVVKALLDTTATVGDWQSLQSAVRKAHELSMTFNTLLQVQAISFVWPTIAELDTLSDFTPLVRMFKPHEKRLQSGEVVVIEEFLEGTFETFSSTVGWVHPNSKTDVTQAFSHYTWYATRDLVVCGLQGVPSGSGFRLTSPTFHSKGCRYGRNDGGLAGIVEFFSTHRCNNICSMWPGLDVPEIKYQPEVRVHSLTRTQNRPRRDRNSSSPKERLQEHQLPKAPSAPNIEATRF